MCNEVPLKVFTMSSLTEGRVPRWPNEDDSELVLERLVLDLVYPGRVVFPSSECLFRKFLFREHLFWKYLLRFKDRNFIAEFQ